jgi:hypothetical protein
MKPRNLISGINIRCQISGWPTITAFLALVVLLTACSKSETSGEAKSPPPSSRPTPGTGPATDGWRAEFQIPAGATLPPEITAFAARKEKQARDLAAKLGVKPSADFWAFFTAAKQGDWAKTSAAWRKFNQRRGPADAYKPDPSYQTPLRQVALDVELAAELFAEGNPDYARAFASDIIQSIPAGSIYFCGNDPSRGLITALCKSHEDGVPFFTISQNALADGTYLKYVEEIYGGRIKVATPEDSQRAFTTYLADATRRLDHDEKFPDEPRQLRPGEDVHRDGGRVQVSGQMAVISIYGALARTIFDNNPSREFFVEESFPLDWMYQHLTPHGLILKINREAPASITTQTIRDNDEYWRPRINQMIGDWLKPETSTREMATFAERTYVSNDLSGFKGDPKFVADRNATRTYSKLRSAQAGLYLWRANDAKDPAERKRMSAAANFAFRQAFALCPSSPEVVFRYVNLLIQQGQIDEALLLVQAAGKIDPSNGHFENLARELERMSQQKQGAPMAK